MQLATESVEDLRSFRQSGRMFSRHARLLMNVDEERSSDQKLGIPDLLHGQCRLRLCCTEKHVACHHGQRKNIIVK